MDPILFNVPATLPGSLDNLKSLVADPRSVNEGRFLAACASWLESSWPGYKAFMTTSCTRALELSAMALGLKDGDEVILSPFNYVGVGNAFAVNGARLVYVDIDPETMNIDAGRIESAITPNTRAVLAMHYAGISCDMQVIRDICAHHGLNCIEDNAQGIGVEAAGRPLGSFGDLSVMSFDTLKNISCNEGGVLLCREEHVRAADIAFSNGSNRSDFLRGLVSKYEWVGKGSKFTMNEYTAAVLLPLLQQSADITANRIKIWKSLFERINASQELQRFIPEVLLRSAHNGHIAYLKFDDKEHRDRVMRYLNAHGVPSAFHYIPLDQSLAGRSFGRQADPCVNSARESERLLRLPMHNSLTEAQLDHIVFTLKQAV